MKPVQLLPTGSAVAAVKLDAKPNYGLIGGIAVALVALVGVGGFFAMARVDTVNSATQQMTTQTQEAQAAAAASQQAIASLGKPVVNRDIQIAQGAEQILVGAYGERREFQLMAQELHEVMRGTGGWYTSITAASFGSVSDSSTASVEIVGYLPSGELATAFDERLDATSTLSKADMVKVTTEVLDKGKGQPVIYWKFTIRAQLAGVDDVSGADTSSLVSGGDTSVELSVDAAPKRATKKKAKAPAAPKNPFDIAAAAAGGAA